MRIQPTIHLRLRSALCVGTVACLGLLVAAPASAAVLDPVKDILDPSPSPSPTTQYNAEPDEPTPIRDAIKNVTGGTDGGGGAIPGGGGGGGNGGGGGGDPTPVNQDPGTTQGGGGGSTTQGATSDGGSSGGGSTAEGGSTSGGVETTDDAQASGNDSYSTLAARGTVAAAGRALSLAGPLAPPLLLGAIALAAVIGLARGSSRLVKLEDTRFPEQTYRL